MENEIQGGRKRYAHQTYGLGVTYRADRTKVRFHKKSWVPQWLWNLLGTPDPFDMLEAGLNRAGAVTEEQLIESICTPVNEQIEKESEFAKEVGLKRTEYPGKLGETK